MKKFLLKYIVPPLIYGILRIWWMTLRCHNINPEGEVVLRSQQGRFIFALWHDRIFYLLYHYRKVPNISLLISPSGDGDLLASVCRLVGYRVIRGSSFKRTFAGSRELLRELGKDTVIAIIADGSRGPRHQAQIGSVQIARIAQAPVFPISFDADRKIVLNSWDRFIIPLPFTRCHVHCAPPIILPRRADESLIQEKQRELADSLDRITRECESGETP